MEKVDVEGRVKMTIAFKKFDVWVRRETQIRRWLNMAKWLATVFASYFFIVLRQNELRGWRGYYSFLPIENDNELQIIRWMF